MFLRGKLKIYFGYSAGVGTTYRMLKDAHEIMRKGVDIVVGYIEPNTSEETIELIEGLEVLPSKTIMDGKEAVNEFNLEGALKRKPKIILIDRMAHKNAVSSKHEKRYLDIEELLAAGIDVFTTLNAHEIESLNNIVTEITKIPAKEKISDYIFDCAEKVKFIDLEPIELIQRYKDGKVFKHEKNLVMGVLKKKNLDMLREISIWRTTKRINECILQRKV